MSDKKHPVAWAVKDYADGWILFHREELARRYAEGPGNGALVRALYFKDEDEQGFPVMPTVLSDRERNEPVQHSFPVERLVILGDHRGIAVGKYFGKG